jgi:ATP-dependent RNA helicase DeaD
LSSFAELPIAPPLARALAHKKYETATPVQASVLDPALAGRDLLVSSQTGSGKTIAFGTLIAESLLREGSKPSPAPRALVVAPTRELAAQVGRELGWLFAEARTRLAAVTGGTAVFGDVRKLRGGVDLVVGTPGRLVDLHKRQALDLSAIEVLVLDEADEMLDLGFKEDLEYLLGAAPAQRRTLMFSATLPREIERLAATFQKNAARIDSRPTGGRPHEDIRYVAHVVRPQDRLAAVVNVLLAAGDAKAIVFCRTRDGVGALHQRLIEHGLAAAAISGERAQGDRDRALEALRSGTARVLVATNVAARGLDLPDVDLVVHADLPENTESLTHRSGRTGRAGKKGTSMVIADMVERRKAERLLSGGRINVPWTAPPNADDVRRALEERLVEELVAEAHAHPPAEGAPAVAPPAGVSAALADRLRAVLPERVLVSLLLAREARRLPQAMQLSPVELDRKGPKLPGRDRPAPDGRPEPPPGRTWQKAVIFRVNLGADANAEPGWLLPLICRRGGVTRREIGAIRVGPNSSTFEIADEAARQFAEAASRPDPRAPQVIIAPIHRIPPPSRPDRPQRPHKPAPHPKRPTKS